MEPEKIQAIFDRIKKAANTDNLAKIGRMMGLTRTAPRKWREGDHPPDLENLIQFCETTGYSLHWIVMGEGDKLVSREEKETPEAILAELGLLMRGIDEPTREALMQTLRTYRNFLETRVSESPRNSARIK